MRKLPILVKDEIAPLEAVVLGIAEDFGGKPSFEEAYDPKSKEHIKAGTFPLEKDLIKEMDAFNDVFEKYNVEVYRPENIENYNQIFCRDIAFVIDNKFIIPNILDKRASEFQAISAIVDQIDPNLIVKMPEGACVEGGDVMPWGDFIFVGVSDEKDFQNLLTAPSKIDQSYYKNKK